MFRISEILYKYYLPTFLHVFAEAAAMKRFMSAVTMNTSLQPNLNHFYYTNRRENCAITIMPCTKIFINGSTSLLTILDARLRRNKRKLLREFLQTSIKTVISPSTRQNSFFVLSARVFLPTAMCAAPVPSAGMRTRAETSVSTAALCLNLPN